MTYTGVVVGAWLPVCPCLRLGGDDLVNVVVPAMFPRGCVLARVGGVISVVASVCVNAVCVVCVWLCVFVLVCVVFVLELCVCV